MREITAQRKEQAYMFVTERLAFRYVLYWKGLKYLILDLRKLEVVSKK